MSALGVEGRGAPLADATPWIEAQNEQSLRVWAPHDANADLPEGVRTAASAVKFNVMSVECGALHPPRVFDTVDVKVKIDHFLKASARLPGGGGHQLRRLLGRLRSRAARARTSAARWRVLPARLPERAAR